MYSLRIAVYLLFTGFHSFGTTFSHSLVGQVQNTGMGVINGKRPVLVDEHGRINHMMRNTVRIDTHNTQGSGRGSGVAIGTRCVLTAQHVSNKSVAPDKLRFYSHNGSLIAEEALGRRANHPTADLALIRLDQRLPWSRGLGLGQIANREFSSEEIQNFQREKSTDRATIMGYGTSRLVRDRRLTSGFRFSSQMDEILREGQLRISGYTDRSVEAPGDKIYTSRLLELTSEDPNRLRIKGAAFVGPGDSGGPVFYQGQLHGIIAQTSSISDPAFNPVKTPVQSWGVSLAHYHDWLRAQYRNLGCDDE